MALPTLDATFASSADLPRKQMLARWLVEELGSGSIADYCDLPERYLWAKIAVAAGGPKTEADYISLPKNYAWSDIYNAVAGSSGNHTDWSENVALGHIAAAYRGDTANPANLATYIDWPWRYKVAAIIGGVTPSGPIFPSDGLLAFWKLDNLIDSSGNNRTLTNNNNVTFTAGKIGNCAEFNGTNGLSINSFVGSTLNTFSVSAWIKRQSSDDFVWFFHSHSGFCFYWAGVQTEDADDLVVGDNSTWGWFSGPNIVPLNQWVHVCVSVTNKIGSIYIDGQYVDTTNGLGDLELKDTTIFEIGQQLSNFSGQKLIDALGIWNIALSASQVESIYNNGLGLEAP